MGYLGIGGLDGGGRISSDWQLLGPMLNEDEAFVFTMSYVFRFYHWLLSEDGIMN